MALVLGTNCGFCTLAPTTDPLGTIQTFDTLAWAIKHTSPAGATTLTEIGVWVDTASEEADINIGLYSDDGASEPNLLLSGLTFAKGTGAGWKL